jgi:hypothetical protein
VAVAAAGSNQTLVNLAEIAYYRAVVASCVANNLPAEHFRQALRNLNAGGA